MMVRRTLLVLAAVAAVLLPGVGGARGVEEPADWILVTLTAGPSGASDVWIETTGQADHTSGPIVWGWGSAEDDFNYLGAWDLGGGPLDLTTTAGAGAIRRQLTSGLSFGSGNFYSGAWIGGHLEPGESIVSLDFFTNAELTDLEFRVGADVGSVELTTVTGRGSQVIYAASPDDEGTAAAIATAAAGSSVHVNTTATGIAGAATSCTACWGSWEAPDSRDGGWLDTDGVVFGFGYGDNGFAGPAGGWRWTWTGAKEAASQLAIGAPTAGAYAPIGDAWSLFAN